MSFLEDLTKYVKKESRVVVFSEAADARMIQAALILTERRICDVILCGSQTKIERTATDNNLSIVNLRIIDPTEDSQYSEEFINACATIPRPFSPNDAKQILRSSLMFSAMMVRLGYADAMIAGATVPTGQVIKAGLVIIGAELRASSYFVMLSSSNESQSERTLIFADCAVNIDPTAEHLANIVLSTAENAQRLLKTNPRIAMLSFSSKGSASHPVVDKVTSALDLVTQQNPDLQIDGELQFDAAISPRTAQIKLGNTGDVAGKANVFIFPDLNSGNIGYKIAQYLGGMQAIGPILQGFAHPICDLSRGASVDDIVNSTILLLATANR